MFSPAPLEGGGYFLNKDNFRGWGYVFPLPSRLEGLLRLAKERGHKASLYLGTIRALHTRTAGENTINFRLKRWTRVFPS